MAKVLNLDTHCDLSPVVLWQYDAANKIKALVASEQKFMDDAVEGFWNDFDVDILNLSTCNSFGLSLWGLLLNTARPTYTVGGETKQFDDEQYRLLLRAKIYLLTFDGSAKSLNNFFKILFPDSVVNIVDNYDMTVTIQFQAEITPEIRAVLNDKNFLPRPSGVQYNIQYEVDYSTILGFEGMTETNTFDNGTFFQ